MRFTTGQAAPKGDASNASWSTEDSTPLEEKMLRFKFLAEEIRGGEANALKLRCIAGVARGLVTYVSHDTLPDSGATPEFLERGPPASVREALESLKRKIA